jgi:hypothetical protein
MGRVPLQQTNAWGGLTAVIQAAQYVCPTGQNMCPECGKTTDCHVNAACGHQQVWQSATVHSQALGCGNVMLSSASFTARALPHGMSA